MTYRDPKQSLSHPILDISAGINEFNAAVLARIKSGEWHDAYLDKISDLGTELRGIQMRLLRLEIETW